MRAKKAPHKAKRRPSKPAAAPAYPASTLSMATHNLINMVIVAAVSGAALLTLIAVKHF
jgi:hypothetical protein